MSHKLKSFVSHLAKVSEADWDSVSGLFQSKKIKKGEHFLKVGEASDRFAMVESGIFRIYYVDSEGKEATKTFRGPGGVIGAYAEFLKQIPCRLYVEALIDSEVSVIQSVDMLEAFKRGGPWERVGRKVAEQLYLEKEEREFQFLCFSAKERYDAFLKNFAAYEDQIPDYMVASYLGITPVYLSKLKKEQ